MRHLLAAPRPTRGRRERVMPLGPSAEGLPRLAESERGLSSVAAAYRRAEPYMAASSTLMASVAGFTALGYGLDRWMGHTVQWMLVAGSVIGIAVGFIGFFTRVLRADAAAKRERACVCKEPLPPARHRTGEFGRRPSARRNRQCAAIAARRVGSER
jgi:ATP synthase protein I